MEPSYLVFVGLTALVGITALFVYLRKSSRSRDYVPDAVHLATRINPLEGLSFDDALDGEKFEAHVRGSVEKALLQSAAGSGIHVDLVELTSDEVSPENLLVTFGRVQGDGGLARTSFKLVRNARGAYKSVAGQVGQFTDLGDLDLTALWLRRLAAGSTAVVSLAHFISGADAARKLSLVVKGQEQLFAYRSIDQFATVRTTYEQLREELGKDLPSAEVLDGIRLKLRQTRHSLMGEARRDLSHLEFLYPEHTGLLAKTKMTWDAIVKRDGSEAHNGRLQALEQFRGKLLLARKCLDFEQVAAAGAGLHHMQAVLVEEAESEIEDMLSEYREFEAEVTQDSTLAEILTEIVRGPGRRS